MEHKNLQKIKAAEHSSHIAQRKQHYEALLSQEEAHSVRYIQHCVEYVRFLCMHGDFERAIKILEPIVLDYQSYPFTPEIIACFNLMGVAAYGQMEYEVSRYYYGYALDLAMTHQVKRFYSYEYSNIALSFIAEENYQAATMNNRMAEQYMASSDADMGAYIYLNQTIIYLKTNQIQKAQETYEAAVNRYDSETILPYNTQIYGAVLYYHLGEMDQYNPLKEQLLLLLENPHSVELYMEEFMDICRELFLCGMESGDDVLIERILSALDSYIIQTNAEAKLKFFSADLKYQYSAKRNDMAAMLVALEQKNQNLESIVNHAELDRVHLLKQHQQISIQLQSAIESKEKASQVKTQFLANMSHDIRTPMNAIVGITKLMEHDIDQPEKNWEHLVKLEASSQHLLSLINDVLDMGRIESGEVQLNQDVICLSEQVRQMDYIMRPKIQGREQEFTVSMEHIAHDYLIGDAVRLRQVVLNMLSNATKYTQNGGKISLTLSQNPVPGKDAVNLTICVTDNGCGMSQEFLAHIYEPFTRADNHLTNKVQGTGLGMAITKKIIDLMGGTISVHSELTKGSCFTVVIPLPVDTAHHAKEQRTHDAEIPPVHTGLNGMRFLCAEDNGLNAEVLEALLDIQGASYTMYANGKELVDAFLTVKPGEYAAVLTDIQMPVMDGLEAAKAIRNSKNPLGATIPIIAMTANAFNSDVKACLDAGMDGHIAKPIDMLTLERTLAGILKKESQ